MNDNQDNKIPLHKWHNMSPSEKTETYFKHTKTNMRAQSSFWNDWRIAFSWFEMNCCS